MKEYECSAGEWFGLCFLTIVLSINIFVAIVCFPASLIYLDDWSPIITFVPAPFKKIKKYGSKLLDSFDCSFSQTQQNNDAQQPKRNEGNPPQRTEQKTADQAEKIAEIHADHARTILSIIELFAMVDVGIAGFFDEFPLFKKGRKKTMTGV